MEFELLGFTFPRDDIPLISTRKTTVHASRRQSASCQTTFPISSTPEDNFNTSRLVRMSILQIRIYANENGMFLLKDQEKALLSQKADNIY